MEVGESVINLLIYRFTVNIHILEYLKEPLTGNAYIFSIYCKLLVIIGVFIKITSTVYWL